MSLSYKLKQQIRLQHAGVQKNYFKQFFFSLIFFAVLASISFFSYRQLITINFNGSSSMMPLINNLTKKYIVDKSGVDVSLQVVGSSSGLNRLIKNQTNIANISDDSAHFESKFGSVWARKKLKTITIAYDGIGIIYKKPHNNCEDLTINKNNIERIYHLFSGYKKNNNSAGYKYNDLTTEKINKEKNSSSNNKDNSKCNVSMTMYSRTGGAQKSGTALAFLLRNRLLKIDDFKKNNSKQYNALMTGEYGNEFNIKYTAEANSEAWSYFKQNSNKGVMIYLSTSFIFNNWDTIIKAGYKIAALETVEENKKTTSTSFSLQTAPTTLATVSNTIATTIQPLQKDPKIIELTKNNWENNIGSKYHWYRPFNFVVSLLSIKEQEKRIIEYMLEEKESIKAHFLKPMDNSDLKLMGVNVDSNNTKITPSITEKYKIFWTKPDIQNDNPNFTPPSSTPKKEPQIFGAFQSIK